VLSAFPPIIDNTEALEIAWRIWGKFCAV